MPCFNRHLRAAHCLHQNVTSTSRRSPTQCRTMALDIVKQYISLLSEFFLFSDAAIITSPSLGSSPTPPMLPRDSNSLTTLHHLTKILGEIQDCVNEVNGMEISSEATSSLKGFLESARWKFDDVLVHDWLRGLRCPSAATDHILSATYLRCQPLLPP